MQMPKERKQDNISENAPAILEEGNEAGESAISIKDGPSLEGLGLLHDGGPGE